MEAEALTQRRGSSRTSSRSDRSKHRYSGTSEFLAHVQLDDAPLAPIQQSFGEEFRQHDGVVTILMFYRRRASPKHCNDIFEVEYGGGGHRTRPRNDHEDQLVCPWGAPCPRNSPVPPKIPEPLRTLPMSEYSRPIYRSLRLDHFETPRHVPDLIRDSKLLRYIKTHKLII